MGELQLVVAGVPVRVDASLLLLVSVRASIVCRQPGHAVVQCMDRPDRGPLVYHRPAGALIRAHHPGKDRSHTRIADRARWCWWGWWWPQQRVDTTGDTGRDRIGPGGPVRAVQINSSANEPVLVLAAAAGARRKTSDSQTKLARRRRASFASVPHALAKGIPDDSRWGPLCGVMGALVPSLLLPLLL